MKESCGKKQVRAIALVTALCLLGDSMLYVVLPIYWREIGLMSLFEVGILLSVNRLVRIPLGPLIGKWYERSGVRTGLIIAVMLTLATTAGYALQGFWIWLVLRCLWGIAWTFLRLGAYTLIISVSTEHNRGQLMGMYNGLYRLGSLGGMVAGALLVAQFGMQATSLLFAALVLPALALIFVYIRQSNPSDVEVSFAPLAVKTPLWKKGSVLVTLMSGLLLAMAYQGVFASTLSRLIELRQPVTVVGGIVIGAAVMASIFQGARWGWEPWAAPWFGRLSDAYGRKPLLVGTMFAAALLFGLLHTPISFAWWVLMLLGIQLTATILTTLMDTWAADEASRQSNSTAMMTMYSVVTDMGAALGPLLAYWMDGSFGLDLMYGGIALVMLLMGMVWLRVREAKAISVSNAL
ncbi:MFS transporter [Brevibacillus sp. AY1]|uniref:MFS transporter n=1 Tax=Brevibacillus sp. AY1 TaxID=2807621 RepID=UPI00245673F6|nr:MFS transporter [Brevibacillus sp. AY1]MDH4616306.1 MFS transporter [Brevibacillus sp. AY1]